MLTKTNMLDLLNNLTRKNIVDCMTDKVIGTYVEFTGYKAQVAFVLGDSDAAAIYDAGAFRMLSEKKMWDI